MREGVEVNALGLITAMHLINAPVNYSTSEIYHHLISGAFFDDLAAGTWTLLPGTPHFQGLTGCHFLASSEVSLLLNLDLCAEGTVSSMRAWCPKACRCEGRMASCPHACSLADQSSLPA